MQKLKNNMKHIKLFEENKNYVITDDLIESGLDQMLEHYLETGKDAGIHREITDMVDNIKYFYGGGETETRWYYHVQNWKDTIEDIIYERMCYHIVEAIKKDPALYLEHRKFIKDMLADSIEYDLDDLGDVINRSKNTGLLDTKIKGEE